MENRKKIWYYQSAGLQPEEYPADVPAGSGGYRPDRRRGRECAESSFVGGDQLSHRSRGRYGVRWKHFVYSWLADAGIHGICHAGRRGGRLFSGFACDAVKPAGSDTRRIVKRGRTLFAKVYVPF